MYGRHAAGHDARAVGHTDRRGNVKAVEARAACGEAVDMRGAHDRIAVAAQMVGAMLVGDDEKKVRLFHGWRIQREGAQRVVR